MCSEDSEHETSRERFVPHGAGDRRTEKQSKLFGLVQTEDELLLVAAADVRAGVDLAKLGPDDVKVDLEAKTATVRLPPAEILGSAIDGEKTYVHTRKTGVLAQRRENL